MKNGVKGIFLNKQSMKYDVRINRRNITYNIGKFVTYEDAIVARDEFLQAYELTPPEIYIEKYSRQWWEEQAELQRERFGHR